jgi:hypothetical protein
VQGLNKGEQESANIKKAGRKEGLVTVEEGRGRKTEGRGKVKKKGK